MRLTWREPEAVPVTREVRAVSNLFEVLARRVGAVPVGADLPRGIRQQKWFAVYVIVMGCGERGRVNSSVGLVAGKSSSHRYTIPWRSHRTKRGFDDILGGVERGHEKLGH